MKTYAIENQNALHILTLTTVGWIDLFTRKSHRDILVDSLYYCQKHKGLVLSAWVIMSNHLHLMAYAAPPNRLSDVLRDFKKFTAATLIKSIKEEPESRRDWLLMVMEYHARFNKNNSYHQLWQQDNHAVELYSPEFIYQKLGYIHENPVRAGWVESPEDYLYSSARNYMNRKGLLDVEMIEFGPATGYVHLGPSL